MQFRDLTIQQLDGYCEAMREQNCQGCPAGGTPQSCPLRDALDRLGPEQREREIPDQRRTMGEVPLDDIPRRCKRSGVACEECECFLEKWGDGFSGCDLTDFAPECWHILDRPNPDYRSIFNQEG